MKRNICLMINFGLFGDKCVNKRSKRANVDVGDLADLIEKAIPGDLAVGTKCRLIIEARLRELYPDQFEDDGRRKKPPKT